MNPAPAARSPLCDSHREEVASLLTHAAGVIFSVFALTGMLVVSQGDALRIVSAVIFGSSLILLYSSSSLYHFFTAARWKARFQALDHACIYLLIAGSYTPVTLISLRGPVGWSIFSIIWIMALAGVLVKIFYRGKKDHWVSTALYLGMGWLILPAWSPLVMSVPAAGLAWLVAGGVTYSLGVVFYSWNKLPFNHAIWHLFVLGGSACHVIAIGYYILRN
jgi:hemolysin III